MLRGPVATEYVRPVVQWADSFAWPPAPRARRRLNVRPAVALVKDLVKALLAQPESPARRCSNLRDGGRDHFAYVAVDVITQDVVRLAHDLSAFIFEARVRHVLEQ